MHALHAVKNFALENPRHLLGMTSAALCAHSAGLHGARSNYLSGNIKSRITKTWQQNCMRGVLWSAALGAPAVANAMAPKGLKTLATCYTAATTIPPVLFTLNRREESDGSLGRAQRLSSRIFGETEGAQLSIAIFLPILAIVGATLSVIPLPKNAPTRVMHTGQRIYALAKPHFPHVVLVAAKTLSAFSFGLGTFAFLNRTTTQFSKDSNLWLLKLRSAFTTPLALTSVVLNISGRLHGRVVPLCLAGFLGANSLNWSCINAKMESSLLPVDLNAQTRIWSLIGVSSLGLYLTHHPRITELFQIFINK